MRLDKHPILMQGYNVVQAIEECGASEKLTRAVIMAGELNNEIEKLVDEVTRLKANAAEKESDLYKMKLHETLMVGRQTEAMRVPGGWIYTAYEVNETALSSTFVPFHNEFEK
jgi:uncharacterized small protein (DUF1192 family)